MGKSQPCTKAAHLEDRTCEPSGASRPSVAPSPPVKGKRSFRNLLYNCLISRVKSRRIRRAGIDTLCCCSSCTMSLRYNMLVRTCAISRDARMGECRSCRCCVRAAASRWQSAAVQQVSHSSFMFPSSSAHQTRWKRPIAIHKNSLPPSVSFVVAEPQQTRSLASATDNLPNILRRAMPHDPSQSNTTPMTIENREQSSAAADSPESPVNVDHKSDQLVLGAVSITSLFRHGVQLIDSGDSIKVPH